MLGITDHNLVVDSLTLNCCNISSSQLSQFSCTYLKLEGQNDDPPITDLSQQIQKLFIHGISLNINNSKQYLKLCEIELLDCWVENLLFINVPNIKSLKLDQCKASKSTHALQNIIKRKNKNKAKLLELKKELLTSKIKNQERKRNCEVLWQEFEELSQLDIREITIGRE
ncbi:Hypothetical_protein [Hexamita inflata]|nr:Hypothetical protein HINF_LOCUS42972 [Hexamita inflata]